MGYIVTASTHKVGMGLNLSADRAYGRPQAFPLCTIISQRLVCGGRAWGGDGTL